jgi:hypothetical protein
MIFAFTLRDRQIVDTGDPSPHQASRMGGATHELAGGQECHYLDSDRVRGDGRSLGQAVHIASAPVSRSFNAL